MNTPLIPFAYGERLVRTTDRNGTPWFVLADICAVFEIALPHRAAASLDEDEKGRHIMTTPGGPQEMTIVNEAGLYRIIFKSRKKEARAFQRFIFHEVIPAIRRTGSYSPLHQSYLQVLREQITAGVSADLAAKAALRLTLQSAQGKTVTMPRSEAEARSTIELEIDEILSHMKPDASYTIPQIVALLPTKHRLKQGGKQSQASAIGKIMTRAVRENRLERDWDFPRTAAFRLPAVVPFEDSKN